VTLVSSQNVRERRDLLVRSVARYLPSTWLNAALVFLVGMIGMHRFMNAVWASASGDSYTMQYDSLRLLHGAVPYRDFFAFPGAGTLWLQALVFAIFGAKASAATYALIVILAVLGVEVYLLAFALTGRWLLSWFAPLFLFFGMAPRFPYPYHHWYAAPFATLAVLFMVMWLRRSNRWWLVGAGGACTATGLFVQTQGVVLVAAIVAFILLKSAGDAPRPPALLSALWRRLPWFTAGAVAVAAPVVVYFLAVGGLRNYIYDTMIWPPLHYGCRDAHCVNNYPFLSDLDVWAFWRFPRPAYAISVDAQPMLTNPAQFYAGLLVMLATVTVPFIVTAYALRLLVGRTWRVLRTWRTERQESLVTTVDSGEDALLLCGLATIALLAVFFIGINLAILHLMWLTILAYPTLLGIIAYVDRRTHADGSRNDDVPGKRFVPVILAGLVLAAGVWYANVSATTATADIDSLLSQSDLVAYIGRHVAPTEKIVVFPSGGITYFYSHRDAAIGYSLVFPKGSLDLDSGDTLTFPANGFYTDDQYREMANQIEQNWPKLIIFSPGYGANYDATYWKSFPPDLFQFIQAHYVDAQGNHGVPDHVKLNDGTYLVYIRQ
jgi:hypothetical protein